MIKTVLFDLDGTLLPMNQEEFVKTYFEALCNKFCPVLNVTSEAMVKGVWKATGAMIKNDGKHSNNDIFWHAFAKETGNKVLEYIKNFDEFYDNEFIAVKKVCGYNPIAEECIKVLKSKGYKLVAATNPIFPAVATKNRMNWAGVNINDFALVTSYENCGFCKPNPAYYMEIMEKLNLKPAECLMVGNDVSEDMIPAKNLGMETYLITDCLENKNDEDYSEFNNGTFKNFLSYARIMPDVK